MNILIVGGYGNVGSMIASDLIETTNAKIIIAGRRIERAQSLANQRGKRATARLVDVQVTDGYDPVLDDVDLAIVCFDLPDTTFARACLERGIGYVDISAEAHILSGIEALNGVAIQNNAKAVISVGVAPGLSNLMAKQGIEQVGETAHHVDNVVLLGLGEAFGTASAMWTLSHIADQYEQNQIHVDMGKYFGWRIAYRFALADQYVIPDTLHINSAATWMCYDNLFFTHLIGLVRVLRLGWLFRITTLKHGFIKLIQKFNVGSKDFVVTTRILDEQNQLSYQAWLFGEDEAVITAGVASEVVRQLMKQDIKAGVHHSEQIFSLELFLPMLEQNEIAFEEQ